MRIIQTLKTSIRVVSIAAVLAVEAAAQIATGGQFTLEKAVVSNGGQTMQAGKSTVTGPSAQTAAGQKATRQQLAVIAGFWTADALATTAAHVTIAGRILTASGGGIRQVRVTMTAPDGEIRTTLSSAF